MLTISAMLMVSGCGATIHCVQCAVVNVTTSPDQVALSEGQTQQFVATVKNTTNTAVDWSLSPPGLGAISSTGLYTAPGAIPSQTQISVMATSEADNTKSAASTVILLSPSTIKTPPVSVSINPGSSTLYGGQSQQFTAAVSNSASTAVTWSASPTGEGAVSTSGLYTAPAVVSSQQSVAITAASQVDPNKTATAYVTLYPHVSVSINPQETTLYAGGTQQFTAAVSNTANTAVTWSISPAGTGSIDSSGMYTAPATIVSSQNLTIMATSQSDQSRSAEAYVDIVLKGNVTLSTQPIIGLGGLVGAFADMTGAVIEPIAIGASNREFIVPPLATRLQLGVDDDYFSDNWGSGFQVNANGTTVHVSSTSRPWISTLNGLNAYYPFGVDGTDPVVALDGLLPGDAVSISYQSGTVSAGGVFPPSNADGDLSWITDTGRGWTGSGYPTAYMTPLSYPTSLALPFTILASDAGGSPLNSALVSLNISGPNAQILQSYTDGDGVAAFTYVGVNSGIDGVFATVSPSGLPPIQSDPTQVVWVDFSQYENLPNVGTLSISPSQPGTAQVGSTLQLAICALGPNGKPISNQTIQVFQLGEQQADTTVVAPSSGCATIPLSSKTSGNIYIVAAATMDGIAVYSNTVTVQWSGA
jgi:hypothetical protein